MKIYSLLSLLTLSLVLSSCLKDEVNVQYNLYNADDYAVLQQVLNLENDKIDYVVELPQHMTRLGMRPPNINNNKALLGRVLFYDKQLSKNQTVSCASCHKQELAFSDDKAFSEGFDGELTLRNSLALGSVANFESSYDGGSSLSGKTQQFFWDERAHSIQQQSSLTIEDNVEMGMNMNDLVSRLSDIDYYEVLFRKAFGTSQVSEERITGALEEFINAMVSKNSKFDEGLAATNSTNTNLEFANFNDKENIGKALFITHCSSCHGTNMSVSPENVANNGLDLEYNDPGVGGISLSTADVGKFKVPFLRNIALTAPYMHDGRFATLEEVVEHYNSGIKDNANLDHRLRDTDGSPLRLELDASEKEALVAFLGTLTDHDMIADSRFNNPFK